MKDEGTRESLTEMCEAMFLRPEQRLLEPFYQDQFSTLFLGDNRLVLPTLEANSFDSCVTDPPYGISFMSRKWDYDVPSIEQWQSVLRVLKPGAFLLAFSSPRTYHRMVCTIEDAGFVIHPLIAWVTGEGFPKATSLSKQIDRRARAEREVVGTRIADDIRSGNFINQESKTLTISITVPATDLAKQWDGYYYGLQALKPSLEPICMAQKPYEGKPVESILKWGCGALNVDASRVGVREKPKVTGPKVTSRMYGVINNVGGKLLPPARWPSNVILEDSQEVRDLFPESKAGKASGYNRQESRNNNPTHFTRNFKSGVHFGDSGSASRFFYSAKADGVDRGNRDIPAAPLFGLPEEEIRNTHATVKPLDLLRYLLTLVTPPSGRVLDPFSGSGSTGVSAKKFGLPSHIVMIEQEQESCEITVERLKNTTPPLKPEQYELLENHRGFR